MTSAFFPHAADSIKVTLVNGEKLNSVNVLDRAFQYGDGVFETIAVRNGCLLAWDYHLARLQQGCFRLYIAPPDPEIIHQECLSLARDQEHAVVKLIISRGEAGRGYMPSGDSQCTRVVMLFPWPQYPDAYQHDGISAGVCESRLSCNPMLAGIKHLNRLEQIMLKREIADSHPEALVMDSTGRLVEGIMSNFFIASNYRLRTPSLEQAGVSGIIREAILDLAPSNGIEVEVTELFIEDVLDADELFFCNSLIGIWPVRELNKHKFRERSIGRRIASLLNEHGLIVAR